MSNNLPPQLKPLPTDVSFTQSRDAGDPGCLCSRCLLPIGKNTAPIRLFPGNARWELRYHPMCLGFETNDNNLDDWKEDYKDLPY